jgi:hypothetical protein
MFRFGIRGRRLGLGDNRGGILEALLGIFILDFNRGHWMIGFEMIGAFS